MRIAIVAASFTPDEADRLRRAMATFRRVGTIDRFQEKMVEGMVAAATTRTSPSAASSRSRASANTASPKATRPASRCSSTSRPGSNATTRPCSPRAAQQPADGLLRPGADRARREGARRRGAPARCQRQRLGLHAGGAGGRRAGPAARLPPDRRLPRRVGAAHRRTRRNGFYRRRREPARRAGLPRRRWCGSPRPTRSAPWGSTGARRLGGAPPARRRRRCRCSPPRARTSSPRSRWCAARHAAARARRRRLPDAAAVAEGTPDAVPAPVFAPRACSSCRQVQDARRRAPACASPASCWCASGRAAPRASFHDARGRDRHRQRVVWPRLFETFRRDVMGARLMLIEGRIQRSPEGIVHLVADRLIDRNAELSRLSRERHAAPARQCRRGAPADRREPRVGRAFPPPASPGRADPAEKPGFSLKENVVRSAIDMT